MILEGHVAPQELALLVVVVDDVEPRRLVLLGVDALVLLLLGDKDIVVLKLEQMLLDLIEDEVLAHLLALVNASHGDIARCITVLTRGSSKSVK